MTEQHMRQTNPQDLAQEILALPAKAAIFSTVALNDVGPADENAAGRKTVQARGHQLGV
ncbi:hypothetical protein [Nonomuraea aridisoli]|uniref:hypothetical protein n=1 Tax=Nonomuraea aridisoli TaxID=2070368 RepID=UPI0015E89110|nr:hypothetical protein [Nonomuraea aridisoli]